RAGPPGGAAGAGTGAPRAGAALPGVARGRVGAEAGRQQGSWSAVGDEVRVAAVIAQILSEDSMVLSYKRGRHGAHRRHPPPRARTRPRLRVLGSGLPRPGFARRRGPGARPDGARWRDPPDRPWAVRPAARASARRCAVALG